MNLVNSIEEVSKPDYSIQDLIAASIETNLNGPFIGEIKGKDKDKLFCTLSPGWTTSTRTTENTIERL